MCLNPASTDSFRYSDLSSVGMKSASPCHASRGHSTSFTDSVIALAFVSCERYQRLRVQHRTTTRQVQLRGREKTTKACPYIRPTLAQPTGTIRSGFVRRQNTKTVENMLLLEIAKSIVYLSSLKDSGFEFAELRVQRRGIERGDQCVARMRWINDR